MKTISIRGGRMIGPGSPAFIIAEAGVNHNGNVDMAHRLIDVAKNCGADAVKFQIFDPDAVVSAGAGVAPYQQRTGAISQRDLLAALTLPESAWRTLLVHAASAGILFFATAFDLSSLHILDALDVPLFKIPSGEIDNLEFLKEVAGRGKPVLVSTGLATLDEVRAAVEAVPEEGDLAILHCVTAYPATAEGSNLRAISTMALAFGIPIGWSDHTDGSLSAIVAVALGASILEKHLTLDKTLSGPDHSASSSPEEFADYVRVVRLTEAALGDGVKAPSAQEEPNRSAVRRSYHAANSLQPGQSISQHDVVLLRPGTGISAGGRVVGRTVRRPVAAGTPIVESDLE